MARSPGSGHGTEGNGQAAVTATTSVPHAAAADPNHSAGTSSTPTCTTNPSTTIATTTTAATSSSTSGAAVVSGADPGTGAVVGAWRWEESDDALLAYGALLSLLALGMAPQLQASRLADLPYFIGLAVATIYIGAHKGLTSRQRQQISIKEGILAPLLASASLFGFYLLIKYLPGLSVQSLLNAYFWALGTFAIGGAAVPLLRNVGGLLGEPTIKFDVPEGLLLDEEEISIRKAELAPTDVLSVALALGLSSAELASGHTSFGLNNLVACLIATDILQLIGPRSFRTAGLLLTGLLLYDVFWVFGSPKVVGDNVMLTVATSQMISGPTRILFPRLPGGGSTAEAAAASFPFSLLGLGDIAIPGLLACLALRYDASCAAGARASAAAQPEMGFDGDSSNTSNGASGSNGGASAGNGAGGSTIEAANSSGERASPEALHPLPVSEAVLRDRPYFTAVMGAYVFGLAAAFVANDVTGLGQPALLYIVPSTLGAVALTGWRRGELGRVWSFTDVPSYGLPTKEAKSGGDP